MPDLGPLTSMLGGGGQAGLIKVLLPALLGGGALAKLGGLGGILGKLQGGGLGNQANSWVGTGQNEDVDPDALESALGADAIDDLAREADVSRDEAKGGLAALLPKLVDQATPGGQVPSSDQLGSIVGKLDLKRLMG
ncbi:MAG: YidB family protein [Ilumatobacteraceae bacterium]